MYWHLEPELPSVDALGEVRLQVPLRVYSADGALLGRVWREAPRAFGAQTNPGQHDQGGAGFRG